MDSKAECGQLNLTRNKKYKKEETKTNACAHSEMWLKCQTETSI